MAFRQISLFRRIVIAYISILLLFPLPSWPITEPEALLKLKQSLQNTTPALDSWVPSAGATTCSWKGLMCFNGVVNGLRLESMGLSGNINVEALLEMKNLRSLSLMNNSFSGNIPNLNQLGALKALYLSRNQFSGQIPKDFFGKMSSLKKVWLNDNHLTGEIPLSLVELPNLIELLLENNQFSGTIPQIDRQALVTLNLSNNNLQGKIPSTLSRFPASSFQGNVGLCREKIGNPCASNDSEAQTQPPHAATSKSLSKISIITPLAIIVIIVIIILMFRKKPSKDEKNNINNNDPPVKAEPLVKEKEVAVKVSAPLMKDPGQLSQKTSKRGSQKFKAGTTTGGFGDLVMLNEEKGELHMQDLMKASAEVLGNGELGSSYKAAFAIGYVMVVKRVKDMNALAKGGFDREVRRLANLKHPNVLPTLAYHYRKDEKLFLHEHVPNSLLYLLHGDHSKSHALLDWPARLKIMNGIADGLTYLHKELSSHDVPHGNLKSSNVLMSSNNSPLLTDFGYSSMLSNNNTHALVAYKTPEAIHHKKVSPKSDVYCFGVIILELLSGKLPSQYGGNNKGGTDVVQCVKSSIAEGRHLEMLDAEISKVRNGIPVMEKLLLLGASCTEPDPEQRPSLAQVTIKLQEICTN